MKGLATQRMRLRRGEFPGSNHLEWRISQARPLLCSQAAALKERVVGSSGHSAPLVADVESLDRASLLLAFGVTEEEVPELKEWGKRLARKVIPSGEEVLEEPSFVVGGSDIESESGSE